MGRNEKTTPPPVTTPYFHRRRTGDYERINTPPPEELDKPATVAYVHMLIGNEMKRCCDEHTETHNSIWQHLTTMRSTMGRILGGLKLAAWLAPVLITVSIAVLVPLIRWAVKGAISEELDKRIPIAQKLTAEETKKVKPSAPSEYLFPSSVASPAHSPVMANTK